MKYFFKPLLKCFLICLGYKELSHYKFCPRCKTLFLNSIIFLIFWHTINYPGSTRVTFAQDIKNESINLSWHCLNISATTDVFFFNFVDFRQSFDDDFALSMFVQSRFRLVFEMHKIFDLDNFFKHFLRLLSQFFNILSCCGCCFVCTVVAAF